MKAVIIKRSFDRSYKSFVLQDVFQSSILTNLNEVALVKCSYQFSRHRFRFAFGSMVHEPVLVR